MNEKCWFIKGFIIGKRYIGHLEYHSEGGPAHVKFDWSLASGKVLGFFHSHPSGMYYPSSRDERTMRAWVRSEGRPMICGIFCDGKQNAYLYYRKGSNIVSNKLDVKIVGNFIWGKS